MEKKELDRFKMAIVKRTAQNTKALRTKRNKLDKVIEDAQAELDVLEEAIEGFEAPIKAMTGGLTSEEVLEEAMYTNKTSSEEVDSSEEVTVVKIPMPSDSPMEGDLNIEL